MREIIEDRVFSLLKKDSFNNPEKIIPSFKSEIESVAEEYLNINGKVHLRYKKTESGFVFMAEIPASSVKNLFYL